ncbi:hypothetical protein N7448_006974 [Penicillium atrosanguineum]|uniref:Uncharacterized protein n=1 Tax=Penicillium atrosanguineum TaxID=1132637 RepID=A0A9W9PVS3_9EURO|nr:uncharacterized protein N7443_010735 [Penicillium atrosanguineum]KAJ5132816.1 hypothetical protein N7448_006974 [Penicillium atrosanguineum]KAJ5141295.1 hypothetical protein N7526_002290 [Penicillium atrosanguineum]KAJ5290482.1 hypothetical protein N7443_010735 [Penicillium atrosanguineum]KAJ5308304.1 hypothetical protein N7476_008960 [Penicillium atrosanguineum]
MKGSSIFQFKGWPKIHQPLPRTPRESQQLLNALTSSFRRQLDHAYPASHVPNHKGDRQLLNTESSAHATDKHLHDILDSPLFRLVPQKLPPVDRPSDEKIRMAETPMVVFDELVASGSVTVPAAVACLKSQLLLARSPDDHGVSEAMDASKAASKVVKWVWATDDDSRLASLQSRAFTGALTKFMAAEGIHSTTALDWLRLLISQKVPARQAFTHLLENFLDAEVRYGHGFGSALEFYLQVCKLCIASPQANVSARSLLVAAGAQLNRIAMDRKPSVESVSIDLYEHYMDVIATFASNRSLLFSSVAVCHPAKPDPRPFIRLAETCTPSKFQKYNAVRQDAFLRIGCDALRILMVDQDDYRSATNLAQQMQNLLPDTTKSTVTETTRSHTSRDEDYLLSRLDLNLT